MSKSRFFASAAYPDAATVIGLMSPAACARIACCRSPYERSRFGSTRVSHGFGVRHASHEAESCGGLAWKSRIAWRMRAISSALACSSVRASCESMSEVATLPSCRFCHARGDRVRWHPDLLAAAGVIETGTRRRLRRRRASPDVESGPFRHGVLDVLPVRVELAAHRQVAAPLGAAARKLLGPVPAGRIRRVVYDAIDLRSGLQRSWLGRVEVWRLARGQVGPTLFRESLLRQARVCNA